MKSLGKRMPTIIEMPYNEVVQKFIDHKKESSPESIIPRWGATQSDYSNGTQFLYDGSYIRLKNVEIPRTLTRRKAILFTDRLLRTTM